MKLRHSLVFIILAILALSRVNPSASKATAQIVAYVQKPVGLTWTGSALIASYRDSVTKLVSIGTDGVVQPFATSFSGKGEVYLAVSHGRAGFPSGDLFLSSGDSIYEVDALGNAPKLFSVPSPGLTLEFVAFDDEGAWGYKLYAITADGGLWSVNSTGRATLVTSLGANQVPEGIVVAPPTFGAYAGYMLVSRENSHDLVAISPVTPGAITTIARIPGEAPERIMTVPSYSDLYIAKYDQGVIVRIGAGNFSSYLGSVLVITEGEAGQTGSISILRPAGNTVNVTRIFEETASPHFEGAAFVPVGATIVSATQALSRVGSTSYSTSNVPQVTTPINILVVVGAVGVVLLLVFIVARAKRST